MHHGGDNSNTLAAAPPISLRRFSTDDYLRMVEAGVLGPSDKVELIDGMIVDMAPAYSPHNAVLMRLIELFAPFVQQFAIAAQGTLVVGEGQVFDPDFMLLTRREDGYRNALPRPGDVRLLIEAAESSLRRYRDIKAPIYAAAGIPDYWIIDIDRESIIVHREPGPAGYGRSETLRGDAAAAPLALPECSLPVRSLFE